jgi:hypothetical protein
MGAAFVCLGTFISPRTLYYLLVLRRSLEQPRNLENQGFYQVFMNYLFFFVFFSAPSHLIDN